MTRRASPTWLLSGDWGVGTDPYNWILYKRGGNSWRPRGYYPSPELLLQSLHRVLTRQEVPDPDLVEHVNGICERVEAAAARLYKQLNTQEAHSKFEGLAHARYAGGCHDTR